nr:adenine phosphoribosyltransferase [bacterium]
MTNLKNFVRVIPDFPREGVRFYDLGPLMADAQAFSELIGRMEKGLDTLDIDAIVGPEARGFVLGGALAMKLGAGFVPVRKAGKLPSEVVTFRYGTQYGGEVLEISRDAIREGQRVLVVDDLLATGSTAEATCQLLEKLGAKIVAVRFALEITMLGGRDGLAAYDVDAAIKY